MVGPEFRRADKQSYEVCCNSRLSTLQEQASQGIVCNEVNNSTTLLPQIYHQYAYNWQPRYYRVPLRALRNCVSDKGKTEGSLGQVKMWRKVIKRRLITRCLESVREKLVMHTTKCSLYYKYNSILIISLVLPAIQAKLISQCLMVPDPVSTLSMSYCQHDQSLSLSPSRLNTADKSIISLLKCSIPTALRSKGNIVRSRRQRFPRIDVVSITLSSWPTILGENRLATSTG
jgi:hypothetical protein